MGVPARWPNPTRVFAVGQLSAEWPGDGECTHLDDETAEKNNPVLACDHTSPTPDEVLSRGFRA